MNGYDAVIKLKKIRRKYPLTATEQALYHELVSICNEADWDDIFTASNDELCCSLNISENTLNSSRLSLIQQGLIYYKSGKSKRQFGKYSFTKKFTTTSIVDTNAATVTGVNPATNPDTNAADSLKQKPKTETKKGLINPFSENFRPHWQAWRKYKLEQFRFVYKSPETEQVSLDDLKKKSNNNEQTAIDMIKQSIANGWKGFFPLKVDPVKETYTPRIPTLKRLGA